MSAADLNFASGLSRAHADLQRDLKMLEQALAPSSGVKSTEINACLEASLERLKEHFRFEEQGGYLAEVLEREPRFERQAQQLLEEHGQLLAAFTQHVQDARQGKGLGPVFRAQVEKSIAKLREHESRENNLVEDAFNMDLSAED